MHASCLQMLPNFTQALQSAAARRNLSSPGTSLGFKNPRINPVPIAEPTNARDMDLLLQVSEGGTGNLRG